MFKFKIDEKSLFFGEWNDYQKGQTATVSTPLNQSNDSKKWRNDILAMKTNGIAQNDIPEMLKNKCTKNTTSNAKTILDSLFVFDKISVDGKKIDTPYSFCMYIKEEVSVNIINKKGDIVENTHLGRKKLHYPKTLLHLQDGFNINNKEILEKILEVNGGFTYIVRGFECDPECKSLNFLTSMVGPIGTRLSTIFTRKKGKGQKLLLKDFTFDLTNLDNEEISELLISSKTTSLDSPDAFEKLNKIRAENGKLGEEFIIEYLRSNNDCITDLFHTSSEFPTSPYDIEFLLGDKKYYAEVKATSGSKKIFNMSSGEIKFMNKYRDNYVLYLVTNVKDAFPTVTKLYPDDIDILRMEHTNTRFYI